MSKINKKYLFWVLFTLFILLFCGFAGSAIYPFVAGFVISYLFLPVANRLESMGMARGMASGAVVLIGFSIVILTIAALAPFLYDKLMFFIQEFVVQKDAMTPGKIHKLSTLLHIDYNMVVKAHDYVISYINNAIQNLSVTSPRSALNTVVNIFATIFVMPIITFYMLKDWKKMGGIFYSLVPSGGRNILKTMLGQVDDSIAFYIRGQISVCVFFMIYYSFLLYLIGVGMGFLLGIMVGGMIFIPYVGFFIGMVISLIVTFIQFGFSGIFGAVCGIFILGQLIDANYTTPKFVGDKVGIHPVFIVLGLFVSAKLFGVWGAVLALPITTSSAILIKFCISRYKLSHYYN